MRRVKAHNNSKIHQIKVSETMTCFSTRHKASGPTKRMVPVSSSNIDNPCRPSSQPLQLLSRPCSVSCLPHRRPRPKIQAWHLVCRVQHLYSSIVSALRLWQDRASAQNVWLPIAHSSRLSLRSVI